jgi:hypothetical protein
MGSTDHSYQATGFTPFFLIYGVDMVLPEDIGYASPHVCAYDEETAEEALQDSLDRLNEHHGMPLVRSARYQQQLRKYHNKHVRPLNFMKGVWFYVECRQPRGKTNSRLLEKDRLLCPKC